MVKTFFWTMMTTVDQRKKDKARFGGLRFVILRRDDYQCVKCGMTQAEHMTKWNKSLTINHIDGNGRKSSTPNNDPDNLETLCLRCHGLADCQNDKWYANFAPQKLVPILTLGTSTGD